MATDIEWAQLAAYIDGEGYIALTRKSRKQGKWEWHTFDVCVRVANTDPRLPLWCRERFGGKVKLTYGPGYRMSLRSLYGWQVYGKNCRPILEGILKYSVIKREQIEIALAYLDTMHMTKNVYNKGKYVPESVRATRNELFVRMQQAREPKTISPDLLN